MPLDRKKIALLHVAKKQLGITDDHWRRLLANVAGVESSNDVHDDDFPYLMQALEAMGFKSDFAKQHGGNLRHWSKASIGQRAKIEACWRELHGGELDPAAMDKWLSRFGADSLQFFDRDQARRAIAALLSWRSRKASKEAS